jgi:hypothetical protein
MALTPNRHPLRGYPAVESGEGSPLGGVLVLSIALVGEDEGTKVPRRLASTLPSPVPTGEGPGVRVFDMTRRR